MYLYRDYFKDKVYTFGAHGPLVLLAQRSKCRGSKLRARPRIPKDMFMKRVWFRVLRV